MKRISLGLVGLLLASLFAFSAPVQAEQICKITDPTGTPLNVRDRPNGAVVNALRNGREVYILEVSYDEQDRQWARVGGYYEGNYRIWGWVLREFVSCYEQ
jgi:hypothetical protein